jgi:hypothetical protein
MRSASLASSLGFVLWVFAGCGDDAATGGGSVGGGGAETGGGGAETGGANSGGGGAANGGSATTGGGGQGGGASCEPELANFYLAPDGNDDGDGSINQPFRTLMKLWTVLAPGDLVYLRGGTYAFDVQQYLIDVDGTDAAPIRIFAYPCETPVLTRAAEWSKPRNQWHRGGIFFSGDHFHFRGLTVMGFYQTDQNVESGFLAFDANNNVFERFDVHHNGHGLYVENASTGNLVLNSDFHHNYDELTGGGNADGLSLAYVTEGAQNEVRGCRAWANSDDGFDTFENLGHVLIQDSWSWGNGYIPDTTTPAGNGVGFKLGSVFLAGSAHRDDVLRTVVGNLAFNNRDYGFHQNEGEFRTDFFHNVAFANLLGGLNFHYENLANTFRNNVSLDNESAQVEVSVNSTSSNNAAGAGTNDGGWATIASTADFVSIDASGVDGPRGADGSLPTLEFLHLAPGSDLIDAGTDVGLGRPFEGAAPDIGAFERE